MFWPYAAAARADSSQHRHPDYRDRQDEDENWPACWGSCLAGQCTMQQDYPGCCHVLQHRRTYATDSTAGGRGSMQEATMQASDDTQGGGSAGLYCW